MVVLGRSEWGSADRQTGRRAANRQGQPVGVVLVFALHAGKVATLDFGGDRATLAANLAAVQLADRGDFSGGAGKETSSALYPSRVMRFSTSCRPISWRWSPRCRGDAFQRAGQIRVYNLALADDEDVLADLRP